MRNRNEIVIKISPEEAAVWQEAEARVKKAEASIECQRRLFTFLCPKTWKRLDRTEDPDIRFCRSCHRNVYFCHSDSDRRYHWGECIACESTNEVIVGRRM